MAKTNVINVFISYSHKDQDVRDKLEKYLVDLKPNNLDVNIHDNEIVNFEEWRSNVETHLDAATVTLMLVSPNLTQSHYWQDIKKILEEKWTKDSCVIPLLYNVGQNEIIWHASTLSTNSLISWLKGDQDFIEIAQSFWNTAQNRCIDLTQLRRHPLAPPALKSKYDNLGDLERTHSCGALRAEHVGQVVTLMGWVARRRDFGPLTFFDLRDRDGITQVVFNAETEGTAHAKAKQPRGEYVIAITGEVVLRAEGQRNPKIATGEVEVQAREILILNDARTPPFQLEVAAGETLAAEDLRLKYRYLDLRRPQLQENLRMRHRMLAEIHRYMDEQGFTQIETPIMIKSTPEGARDYVVPSRTFPGKFYALPQSPQLFKQLCMIAGLDKYYQIARCFRDEDLRADRQPEFSQLDVEMSFPTLERIYALTEGYFAGVFRACLGVELPTPFPRLTYAEAMRRYGSDKPDLRFGIELRDIAFADAIADFPLFSETWNTGGEVKCLVVAGGAAQSRKRIDELTEFVKRYGARGLAWIKLGEETSSSLLKALGAETVERVAQSVGAKKGDLVLIVSDKSKVVAASLGALRVEIAKREKLIPENVFKPLWVTEFPMFEHDEETDRYYAMHHPFTSALDEDLPQLERAVEGGATHLLAGLRAKAYDAVINGVEVAGGSIRIHRRDVQRLIFKALGMSEETARERFGFFLDALEFGTPPHGGIASGIERTLMVLANTENIRDVMAFPKTASAADLMIDAPGEVDPHMLEDLHIQIAEK